MGTPRLGPSSDQPDKETVIQELREAIKEYGAEAGPKLVRKRYPDIARSTWYRWLSDVSASPMDVAIMKARGAAAHLPAAPSPAYIAEKPEEARKNMDFMARWEKLYEDAEMLRASAVAIGPDGKEKAKIPMFLAQSIKLRLDLMTGAIQAFSQIYDLQRLQRFQELILEEIGKESPEAQQRITAALKALDDKLGITMDARL